MATTKKEPAANTRKGQEPVLTPEEAAKVKPVKGPDLEDAQPQTPPDGIVPEGTPPVEAAEAAEAAAKETDDKQEKADRRSEAKAERAKLPQKAEPVGPGGAPGPRANREELVDFAPPVPQVAPNEALGDSSGSVVAASDKSMLQAVMTDLAANPEDKVIEVRREPSFGEDPDDREDDDDREPSRTSSGAVREGGKRITFKGYKGGDSPSAQTLIIPPSHEHDDEVVITEGTTVTFKAGETKAVSDEDAEWLKSHPSLVFEDADEE